jgi:hypothetical protein
VEFALVIIPFFLILFSTIEFALITASTGSFNFAERHRARLGSLLGRTVGNADSEIVAALRTYVRGVVMAKTVEVDIYKSTPDGQCLYRDEDNAGGLTGSDQAPSGWTLQAVAPAVREPRVVPAWSSV